MSDKNRFPTARLRPFSFFASHHASSDTSWIGPTFYRSPRTVYPASYSKTRRIWRRSISAKFAVALAPVSSKRIRLTVYHRAAVRMQYLSSHVGGIVGREENVTRSDFFRLTWATKRNIGTERRNFIFWKR